MMAHRRQATTAIFTFSDDEKLTGAAIEDVAAKENNKNVKIFLSECFDLLTFTIVHYKDKQEKRYKIFCLNPLAILLFPKCSL